MYKIRFQFFVFLWIGIISSQSLHLFGGNNKDCVLVINEINTGTPENMKKVILWNCGLSVIQKTREAHHYKD